MRKFLTLFSGVLFLSLTSAVPSAHAQIWSPDHGPWQVSIGYQYQHYNLFGSKFYNNGENATIARHVFDPLTGAKSRITAALEGTVANGFGGHVGTGSCCSVFFGGGPHLAVESNSRIEPWMHLLVGMEHLRFPQTGTVGSENGFGFMAGGGWDIRFARTLAWRVQVDYLGSHFQPPPAIHSNYSFGSGFVINF